MNAKSQINWVLCYITFDDICCRIKRALNLEGLLKLNQKHISMSFWVNYFYFNIYNI